MKRHRIPGAPRRAKHKKSKRIKVIDLIRRMKASAVFNRLGGSIQNARHYEDVLDRAVSEAERKGWDYTNAEEAGARIGERLHRKRSK